MKSHRGTGDEREADRRRGENAPGREGTRRRERWTDRARSGLPALFTRTTITAALTGAVFNTASPSAERGDDANVGADGPKGSLSV
jgi:hypothetical protein